MRRDREIDRGTTTCKTCKYFGIAKSLGRERCRHESNISKNWLGTVYLKRPDTLNIYQNCENYEETEEK